MPFVSVVAAVVVNASCRVHTALTPSNVMELPKDLPLLVSVLFVALPRNVTAPVYELVKLVAGTETLPAINSAAEPDSTIAWSRPEMVKS